MQFALTAYIEAALGLARYDKLEDGTFTGEIPRLPGVVAFGPTLRQCEHELRGVLEDWILVGLRLGHRLPKLSGIDLNRHQERRAPDHPRNIFNSFHFERRPGIGRSGWSLVPSGGTLKSPSQ